MLAGPVELPCRAGRADSMRRTAFNRSRWQVYRERCHIADATPPTGGEVVPIGSVIAKLVGSLDVPTPAWFPEMIAEWTLLAGQIEARHARPGRFRDGTLTVFVDGAVWLNELKRYWAREMLDKLQRRFGRKTIAKLVLQPDPDMRGPGGKG